MSRPTPHVARPDGRALCGSTSGYVLPAGKTYESPSGSHCAACYRASIKRPKGKRR